MKNDRNVLSFNEFILNESMIDARIDGADSTGQRDYFINQKDLIEISNMLLKKLNRTKPRLMFNDWEQKWYIEINGKRVSDKYVTSPDYPMYLDSKDLFVKYLTKIFKFDTDKFSIGMTYVKRDNEMSEFSIFLGNNIGYYYSDSSFYRGYQENYVNLIDRIDDEEFIEDGEGNGAIDLEFESSGILGDV